MFGISMIMVWFFILLFIGILVIYFRFLGKTIHFLLKGRPLSYEMKWKQRFPVLFHARMTQGITLNHYILFTLLVVLLGGSYVYLGGDMWFAIFSLTTLFAILMLAKEFSLHYYWTENELIAWSVHEKTYHTTDGDNLVYEKSIQANDIQRVEEIRGGLLLYLKDNEKLYVAADKKQAKSVQEWLDKQKIKEMKH